MSFMNYIICLDGIETLKHWLLNIEDLDDFERDLRTTISFRIFTAEEATLLHETYMMGR